MPMRWLLVGLLVVLTIPACGGKNGGNSAEAHGQITRPGDVGLPLDNPQSVAAFDLADRFLLSWFFLEDVDRALGKVRPADRETWRSTLEETEIEDECSLLQVEGSTPDETGEVMARYAIIGCDVTPPSGMAAAYIEVTVSPGDGGPWVSKVEFLR